MDNNNNNNQIENANQNQNENEMKNLEKKFINQFYLQDLLFNESLRQESLSISLNQFNKKRNGINFENQRLKGKKEKEKEKEKGIEKKRLFHSFFSLFDKDSISKQDFDKLKQFDFFPKSFLVDIQNKVIQDNQKEIENKEKEIEDKNKEIENKEKEIEDKNKEIEDKNKENQEQKQEIEERWKKEVDDKNKENQQMKIEIEEKWKKEVENKEKENQQMKIEIEEKWKKEIEKMKQEMELQKNFPQFSDSEIIQDIEYVKKLQEWINDNDFFSKMKKGFSAKRDGFNSQNWHKAVDGKGKTLIIIKTKDNFIFGGFTQVGFKHSNAEWINDSNAFIFSLRNDKGDRIPAKFTIKQPQYAILSALSNGPWFGNGSDFLLNSDLKTGQSNFGKSYNLPNGITFDTDSGKSYLAGSLSSWVVDELETYFI
ncbi:hypothetical protein M0811_12146 [Anaeramoeba ignava]|uniref:TLDc domain-containing protein n=1 Tax=Anaeramoeba ignava TaxID=1746090 RepID=A0A9Q0LCN8_ANAIG|nr:hypothetical protein M0811_12146 [Anaeramoeba ignava]